MGGAERSGDEVVEVRGVAEEEDGREFLVLGEFAEELERFGTGEELVSFADFIFGVGEFVGEDFGGLRGAEIGAGEEEVGRGADFAYAFGHLAGFLDSLLREETIGVGGTVGVFAINGDAVADDIELHAVGSCEEFTRRRKDLTQRAQRGGEEEKRARFIVPLQARDKMRRGKPKKAA
jgi:hypothetical protein